ncbi:PAS domain S-box protein [Roseospira navarrensis]|uniref:histidine kinase n=1 Tax=Roseospira navarrensis TaxID=140058 RepID=A0A7X1ZFI7_9PROT|nr:PAS domain S-box protein [Roseospira navarrensis]MQX36646.1 PAS domain S-box protein [Roseospira navarrensis]
MGEREKEEASPEGEAASRPPEDRARLRQDTTLDTPSLDRLFGRSPVPMACLDRDGTVVWGNEALARRRGRSGATWAGRSVDEMLADPHTTDKVRRSLADGTPLVLTERPLWRPDQPEHGPTLGTISLTPLADGTDPSARMILTLTEISPRATSERNGACPDCRLTRAIRAADIGIWEWNLRTGALIWNPSMFALYGVDPDTFQGRAEDWSDRVHPEDLARLLEATERTRHDGATFDTVFRIRRPDGTVRHVRSLAERRTAPGDGAPVMVGVNYDVTAECELQARLDKIARTAPGVFFQYRRGPDGTGSYPYVSQGMQEIFGVPTEAIRRDARVAFNTVHPEDLPRLRESMEQSFRSLAPWALDYRLRRPDRPETWIAARAVPEREADGSVLWHGFLHDITDRKRDETIRDALATVVDHSDDIFVVKDLDLRVVATNQAFVRASGNTSIADMLGKTDAEIFGVSPESEPVRTYMVDDRKAQSLPRGSVIEREEPVVHPNGTVRTVLTRKSPIFDRAGRLAGTGNIAIDITERKDREARLKKLSQAVEQSPASIVIADADGRIEYANRHFCRVTGYAMDEVLGRPVLFCQTEDMQGGTRPPDDILERVRAGATWSGEVANRRRDGSPLWESVSIGPIFDDRNQFCGLLAVKEDITSRKAMEDRLRRSNEDLEQFAYAASHDLQAPLRTISSFLGLLRQRYGASLDADAAEFIDYSIEGAKRLSQQVHGLLDFSRITTTPQSMTPVALDRPVSVALAHLRGPIADTGARIERPETLPTVIADADQLALVFQNLIANALKYARPDTPPEVRISVTPEGPRWRVAVADNGIGIAPEYHGRIFGVFQRLHGPAEFEGTGIGLAVCKRIVDRHGGELTVDSDGTGGSTFIFTLPGLQADVAEPHPNL